MKKLGLAIIVLSFVFVGSAYAADLSGHVTTDNAFDMYISTNDATPGTPIGSGVNWQTPLTFASVGNLLSTSGTYYLHVRGLDYGYIAGFLGDFKITAGKATFQNGTQSLLTNTTDWTVRENGFDGNLLPLTLSTQYGNPPQTGTGQNGSAPWGLVSTIDPAAQWIWTENGRPTAYPPNAPDQYRYFSTKITVTPEPVSMVLFGLGIGVLGLSKFRSNKK